MGFPPPPSVCGVGPTPLPRPERLYFAFANPIASARFGRRYDDTAAARALRDEVKQATLMGVQFLPDERDLDPHRGVIARLRHRTD